MTPKDIHTAAKADLDLEQLKIMLNLPNATLASLDLAAARADVVAAEAAADIDKLNAARPALLLTGTDDALAEHDEAIAAYGRRNDRAAAFAVALRNRAVKLRADAAEQIRVERYAAAETAGVAITTSMPEKYGRLVALAREILTDLADARDLVRAANHDLPEGRVALPDPEHFRHQATHARIVSKEPTMVWCREDGTPLSDAMQGSVVTMEGGLGMRPAVSNSSSDPERFVRKAAWRVTVEPALNYPRLDPFDIALAIPRLYSDGAEGWRQDERFPRPIQERLAEIRSFERAPATPVKELITEGGLADLKSRHRIP